MPEARRLLIRGACGKLSRWLRRNEVAESDALKLGLELARIFQEHGYQTTGEARLSAAELIDMNLEDRVLKFDVCIDLTEVDTFDEDGASLVDNDRPGLQSFIAVATWNSKGKGKLSSRDPSSDNEICES